MSRIKRLIYISTIMTSFLLEGCLFTRRMLETEHPDPVVYSDRIEGIAICNDAQNMHHELIIRYVGFRPFIPLDYYYYYALPIENKRIPPPIGYVGSARSPEAIYLDLSMGDLSKIKTVEYKEYDKKKLSISKNKFTFIPVNTSPEGIFCPDARNGWHDIAMYPYAWTNDPSFFTRDPWDSKMNLSEKYNVILIYNEQPVKCKDIVENYFLYIIGFPSSLIMDIVLSPYELYLIMRMPVW